MTTFRIYNVVDKTTGAIVKIGSTVQTLKERSKRLPYTQPKYANCELVLLREFECEDAIFGLTLLRVREQFEISRAHLWADENGWNITRPVQTFINGCDDAERLKASGLRLTKQCTPEHQRKAAKAAGKVSKESGQIQELGYRYGKITGIKNCQEWNRKAAETGFRHLAKNRTSEHQKKAGRAAGKNAKEKGLGIWSPSYDKKKGGIASASKKTPEQRIEWAKKMILFRAPGHQQKAAWANAHKNFHVPRNKINPKCPHCSSIAA